MQVEGVRWLYAAVHGSARAPDEPPPRARPSDRRFDAPDHSAKPFAAPRPCALQHPVCRRSAEALGTPVSDACSERLGRARGLRPSKTTHDSVSQTFCRVVLGKKPPHTSRERAAAMTDVYVRHRGLVLITIGRCVVKITAADPAARPQLARQRSRARVSS